MNLEPMDQDQLLSLLDEVERRKRKNGQFLLADSFPEQKSFIEDKSKLIALLCTRRAGKSMGIAIRLIKDAIEHDNVKCVYIALTRRSAESIMWADCIKALNRTYALGMEFNETKLQATLPNGSSLSLVGADSNRDEMEKLLGQKFYTAAIDEAASFTQDLKRLVFQVLKPAVADYNGTIILGGTPGNITNSLFYDVTSQTTKGWSLHKWSALDNPHIATQWQKEIDDLIEMNAEIVQSPLYKQMYLGEWFIDTERLVYKHGDINLAHSPPDRGNRAQFFVLGVDLGYDPDPSAFVLTTYFQDDPTLYVVETFKQTKMIISDVAEVIKSYFAKYPQIKVVIDAANKQAVEEMRQRYALSIVSSEKHGKPGFIEIMNSDLAKGLIKLAPECSPLADEWKQLVWAENTSQRKENSSCANHLSDAALYAWRYCYNYTQKVKTKVPMTDQKIVEQFWETESNKVKQNKSRPIWETELENPKGDNIYGY